MSETDYRVEHGLRYADPELLGAPIRRVEDARLITGKGRFVADVPAHGMVHAAFVRSPEPHARILDIGTAEAEALPGVVAVLTAEMLADKVSSIRADATGFESWQASEWPVLARDRVRFVGEPVAVVLADSRYVAEDAVELVNVELQRLAPVMTMEDALRETSPVLHDGWQSNVVLRRTIETGDVDTVFGEAPHQLSFSFTTQRYAAVPLETRGLLATYTSHDDTLTLWDATQVPHLVRAAISEWVGHPEHRIRVIAPDVGGGFGLKCNVFPEEAVIAYAAKLLARPVSWIEDRSEHLIAAAQARDTRDELEVAFSEDGVVQGIKARVLVDNGAYSVWPFTACLELSSGMGGLTGPYRVDHLRIEGQTVMTTKTPHASYRGVGRCASCFALERAIDEIARYLGLDPLDVRRRNVVRDDEFPWRAAGGQVIDSGSYRKSLETLEEVSGLAELRERQAELRAAGRYIGIGLSCFNEQTANSFAGYMGRGVPVVVGYEKAMVRMDAHGKVTVYVGTAPQGQGHETSLAQVVAAQLGVAVSDVRIVSGDTETCPAGMGTYSSRTQVMAGGAIRLATKNLQEKLARLAAAVLECDAADVVAEKDRLAVAGYPPRFVTIAELAAMVHLQSDRLPPGESPLLEETAAYRGGPGGGTYGNGAHLAHVEVDPRTGKVSILDYFVVEDCGTVVNPTIVDGQLHGGVAQGIGGALFEELRYDNQTGQPLSTTFLEYRLPCATDVPSIHVRHLCTPSPFTPGGVKGVGEAGMTGTPAAVANAVADAIAPLSDRIVDTLPLSPERVYAYCESTVAMAARSDAEAA